MDTTGTKAVTRTQGNRGGKYESVSVLWGGPVRGPARPTGPSNPRFPEGTVSPTRTMTWLIPARGLSWHSSRVGCRTWSCSVDPASETDDARCSPLSSDTDAVGSSPGRESRLPATATAGIHRRGRCPWCDVGRLGSVYHASERDCDNASYHCGQESCDPAPRLVPFGTIIRSDEETTRPPCNQPSDRPRHGIPTAQTYSSSVRGRRRLMTRTVSRRRRSDRSPNVLREPQRW